MQPLHQPRISRGRNCAQGVMGALPPVVWYMRRQMRGHRGGLSMPQFRALVRIECEPSASITSIAEHLATSLSTTSRLVSGLVRRGYLERNTAAVDRRQARVTINPKGRAVLQTAREATCRKLEGVFASLAPREQDVLIDAMTILKRRFIALGDSPESVTTAEAKANGNGRAGRVKAGAGKITSLSQHSSHR